MPLIRKNSYFYTRPCAIQLHKLAGGASTFGFSRLLAMPVGWSSRQSGG
jgi:hypothetical protein